MSKLESNHRLAREYTCPVCKKPFYVSIDLPDWGYQIKVNKSLIAVCSYTCQRNYEKPKIEKQKKRMQKEFQKAWDDEVKIWDSMRL